MPSKLTTATANAPRMRAIRERAVAAVQQARGTLTVKGPFLGFQPDVDPNLTDGTAFNQLQNVLARAHSSDHGEVLGLPDGFRQLDAPRLPLGDGSSLPPAPAGDPGAAVVRVDQLGRVTPSGTAGTGDLSVQWVLTPMAVTAGNGTGGTGNMYRISAGGQWTFVGPDTTMTAPRQLSAGRDGRTPNSPSMPDSCVAPFGATARAAVGGAGADGQSGAINEPAWIFTNDVDEVMVFPSSSADTIAGNHFYEPLTSVATLDGGGATGFRAKSVETWNGRVYFLNTSEGPGAVSVRRQQRLRRTAKFTCDPDPAIVGAGFFDFREFQGEGLRIETLGDVLAVYFSDGIAFLRPTGVPTSPDEPQVLSTERGLLSTHAVCAIGRNVHFGIFTDGWWLLDQSGRWQEVGVTNLDGKIVPKWRQTFYEAIPANQRHRLYTYYDQPNNLIYIARPTIDFPDPQEVWIYDPTSDRVFIENYPLTCMGTLTPFSQAGVTIDALPGTIDSLVGTIDSFGPIAGFPRVRVHGDLAGFVYQHKRDLVGFHGQERADIPTVQEPNWLFALGLRSPASFRNLTTVDRVSLEYFNHQNENAVSITVRGPVADGSQTRLVLLDGGSLEDLRSRDAWYRYSAQAVGVEVSGVGEFHIRGLAADVWADPVEPRGL